MLATSFVLLSVALGASATDYLVSTAASSARLSKRGLLENGNYNISAYFSQDEQSELGGRIWRCHRHWWLPIRLAAGSRRS